MGSQFWYNKIHMNCKNIFEVPCASKFRVGTKDVATSKISPANFIHTVTLFPECSILSCRKIITRKTVLFIRTIN